MFPPVDDAVLQNNPDFARLYKNLTGNVLNPDGSSKDDDPLAKERAAVRHVSQVKHMFAYIATYFYIYTYHKIY